eukprot:m.380516 g.380516  ORF g.380516 m.380516 type:complete len:65 (+) comp107902_c0_seq1:1-195(+)
MCEPEYLPTRQAQFENGRVADVIKHALVHPGETRHTHTLSLPTPFYAYTRTRTHMQRLTCHDPA